MDGWSGLGSETFDRSVFLGGVRRDASSIAIASKLAPRGGGEAGRRGWLRGSYCFCFKGRNVGSGFFNGSDGDAERVLAVQ